MKSFPSLSVLAALASICSAATVTLTSTQCQSPSQNLDSFTINVGGLVQKQLDSVCGLKITSADGVNVTQLTCQAFKDSEGNVPGSAKFTYETPALIATNPVQEAAIRCDVGNTSSATSATTTFTTSPFSASPSASTSAPASASASTSGSVSAPRATTLTSVSFASSAPSGTSVSALSAGNGTSLSATRTPTTTSGSSQFTAAAGKVGWNVVGMVAAFAIAFS